MTNTYRIGALEFTSTIDATEYDEFLAMCARNTCDDCGEISMELERVYELENFHACPECSANLAAMIDAADEGDTRAAELLAVRRKPVVSETRLVAAGAGAELAAVNEDCPF
jgi:hypothetical protein